MKHRLRPFGFPAWLHCRRRVAKKHLKSRNMYHRYKYFHDCPDNQLINDCTGLNMLPEEVWPEYFPIARRARRRKAKILYDIRFVGPTNSCSFGNCGVEPPKTLEECAKSLRETLKWAHDPNNSYKSDRWDNVVLHADGTFEYGDKK